MRCHAICSPIRDACGHDHIVRRWQRYGSLEPNNTCVVINIPSLRYCDRAGFGNPTLRLCAAEPYVFKAFLKHLDHSCEKRSLSRVTLLQCFRVLKQLQVPDGQRILRVPFEKTFNNTPIIRSMLGQEMTDNTARRRLKQLAVSMGCRKPRLTFYSFKRAVHNVVDGEYRLLGSMCSRH